MLSVSIRHVIAALAVPLLVFAACGDDGPSGHDGDCAIGDPIDGRDCECNGNECICPSTGDCAILCAAECDLQCAGSGSCEFDCGPDCAASCTGSGNCDIEVGSGSIVSCTGSGDCDVTCHGDCTVRCPGSGTCTIFCDPEVVCDFESCSGNVETCPDGVQVCQGSCPG